MSLPKKPTVREVVSAVYPAHEFCTASHLQDYQNKLGTILITCSCSAELLFSRQIADQFGVDFDQAAAVLVSRIPRMN